MFYTGISLPQSALCQYLAPMPTAPDDASQARAKEQVTIARRAGHTDFVVSRQVLVDFSNAYLNAMIERRVTQLLPMAALAVLLAALGLAWVIEPSLAPAGWMGRLAVLLAGVCIALFAFHITFVQAAKSAQSARRHIDCLCALDAQALNDQDALNAIPLRNFEAHADPTPKW